MDLIRKMAVFWLLVLSINIGFGQNRAAYLATSSNSATLEHNTSKTTPYSIPFEKAGNLLLVKAEIDAIEGIFILDTGAPRLVINQAKPHNAIQAQGVTGKLMVNDTLIKKFRWNNVEWKNVSGLAVDMKHFNDVSSQGIKGLIGYEILKDYEVIVDPTAQTIFLLSNRKDLPYNPDQVLTTIPMVQHDHMPIVEISINGKKILLGIDTGAEINFLDKRLLGSTALEFTESMGWSVVKGLGTIEKRDPKIRVKQLSIGNVVLNDQTFTVADLTHLFPNKEGLKIQGIIGIAFLNQFRYSINYRKGTFSVISLL